ncbi:uncharacterized protein BJ171DRAFT_409332, partial [Polychytrium aggregatum]|uniref:uncharacterized protein n=1 Tax=Polychytrium aggregatum TaxID=110093 RepID=UPI0022FE8552
FHCPHPGCEQSFTRRYNLKTHFLASHIGERNFVCPICDVGFARKYDLIRHGSL